MTDEAQKLIESEDEDEVVIKKRRKVSKTTPKKTPKKVSREVKKKDPKKIQKKKKTLTIKGDVKAPKKTGQSKQVGCAPLAISPIHRMTWCGCKPRR